MKSFNLLFKDEKLLDEFIGLNVRVRDANVLVQIFTSVIERDYIFDIAKMIKSKLPKAHVMGTTTCGEVCAGKMYDGEIVISFTLFETSTIKSKLYKLDDSFSFKNVYDELISDDTKVMIIFSDGLKSEAEPLLKGLYDLKHDMIIAGGRAGDKDYKQTYIFNDVKISDEGCVITTLSGDDLLVNSDYILKWTPIGKDMLVTKAEGSVLYELDNVPIMEVYKKYLGEDVVKNLPESSMSFPLVINKEGLLVARDPIAVTKDGAFVYAGSLEIGDIVRFSFANLDEFTDNIYNYFEDIKNIPAEAIFIYSCAARKALLAEKLQSEITLLDSIAPTVGFFTFGEYYHFDKIVELLNVTTTFLMLSESNEVKEKKLRAVTLDGFDPTRKALTHLVKVTTQELENISRHDILTSLYNRAEYKKILHKKIKSAQRYGEIFGLIMIDIDFFKLVNDNYGHNIGDEVLKKFAQLLLKNIREDDVVARWGGEEFIVIANYVSVKELEKLTKKLRRALSKLSFSPVPKLTASFGLAVYKNGDSEDSIFKRVDNALYMAKQTGRDKYVVG